MGSPGVIRPWRAALLLLAAGAACAQQPCTVTQPTASFEVPRVAGDPPITADPAARIWRNTAATSISKDCSRQIDYPSLRTEVRSFWTGTHLYLLFSCPYHELNLFLPALGGGPRDKLWDRDAVEMFLGSDWKNIRHYREFEIAPTGDWIDLAIDLDRQSYDQTWRSKWTTAAHIDEVHHIWYAAARDPAGRGQRGSRKTRLQMARQTIPHRRAGPRFAASLYVLAAHLRGESRSKPCPRKFRDAGL